MRSIFFSTFVLLILFVSCDDSQVSLETIDELTIEAFLIAGESLDSVRVGKIIPLDTSQITSSPINLSPKIYLDDGSSYDLYLNDTDGAYAIYGNENIIIEEEMTYRLEMMYNDKLVSAETYIPFPPEDLTLSAT